MMRSTETLTIGVSSPRAGAEADPTDRETARVLPASDNNDISGMTEGVQDAPSPSSQQSAAIAHAAEKIAAHLR